MHQARRALFVVSVLALAGCALHPRPQAPNVNTRLTLAEALAHPHRTIGVRVRWGGMILRDTVGAHGNTLTVLAYPLTRGGRPRLSKTAWGRFQAHTKHYLDPIMYARGRLITIVGTLNGTSSGYVGQARYIFAQVALQASHVWRFYRRHRRSHWQLSLGVGMGM